MGAADVVPGVSGGTVALITGIYERLVTAISHIDLTLLFCLRHRKWKMAAGYLDLRFLVSLAAGIAGGFVCMSLVMHQLRSNPTTRNLTLAAFFGMILASSWLVAKMVRVREPRELVAPLILGLTGAAFACWLTTLTPEFDETTTPGYFYLFLCGSVAICAMILPGISGAMITLLLGVYDYMTEIPDNLLHGEHVGRGLLSIVAFGGGAVISLIVFSKVLRKLLKRFHSPTMGLLCGLMVGSLPMLWPFQVHVTKKTYRRVIPETINGHVLAVAGITLAGLVLVLVVDRMSRVSARPIVDGDRSEPPKSGKQTDT